MSKPLIFRFAVSQKKSQPLEEIPYRYSRELNLNVIDTNGKETPFVGSETKRLELITLTRIAREGDDFNKEINKTIPATLTGIETYVAREGSDETGEALLELLTKTEATRERDE